MARVSYVQPQNAPPEVKEIYDKFLKGKPGNIQKALAHQPRLLAAFLPFYGSIGRSLDKRLYEMIYIRVAYINKLPVLTQAPPRFVEASRADGGRLVGAQESGAIQVQ